MAINPLFFLLLRNSSPKNPNFRFRFHCLIRETRNFKFSNGGNTKCFSTSQSVLQQPENNIPNISDTKPTSLSARMSFVFDQIDAIEKERNSKDEALQRIRSWRETKKKKNEEESSELKYDNDDSGEIKSSSEVEMKKKDKLFTKEIEMVHPWPEWIELMERLVQQNYFDHRRNDEDKLVENLPIDLSEFEEGFDFTRDWMTVRNACNNFGRDRFDILRSLSRQDIQVLVGYGCPSVDTKVVFSAKMLRKYVHFDEGDVCSSCNLRSTCSKAYLLARKEDEARTVDVIRVLLTFGFDAIKETVENRSLLKMKSVKTVVRKLLHEVVKLSAVPIDPNLPPPVIKKPPPKVKQPPPPPKKRVGRDDIEMKKGDWLCPKCDFMNFAKNTVCLQCDGKRPKRQLLPGEWECPNCNFLNYRRNTACFHCEHERPPDEFTDNHNQTHARSPGPRTRLERVASMPGVSNAWNFDFDDNESDGADVAAFEFADSPRMDNDSSVQSEAGNSRDFEDDSFHGSRTPRAHERGRYPNLNERKPTTGFDDFDDEEDDDVNSYELVTGNSTSVHVASVKDLSEGEGYSESEDFDSSYPNSHDHRRASQPSCSKGRGHDFDSEEEDSVPNLRAGHNAKVRSGSGGRGGSGPYRGLKFDSDDEFKRGSGSDDDIEQGFGPNHRIRSKWTPNRKVLRGGGNSDSEDGIGFGSESDDDLLSRDKMRGRNSGPDRRGNTSIGRAQFVSARDTRFRSNHRRDSFDNADAGKSFQRSHRGTRDDYGGGGSHRNNRGSNRDEYDGGSYKNRGSYGDDFGGRGSNRNSRGSYGDDFGGRGSNRNSRGSHGDDYGGKRMNDRRGNSRNFSRGGDGDGFGHQQRGRSNGFNDRPRQPERRNDFGDDRPRRRIIER